MVDKDRMAGSAKVITGTVKEAIGTVTGDAKLETEGRPTVLRARSRTPLAASRRR
jgi:uncharacterized protein YjbJ (UPF0337 family)